MTTAKTIHDAVSRVLREQGHPCQLQEIVDAITASGLYSFKVDDPRGVVRQAIRRRCEGCSSLDRAGQPLFREVRPGTYALIEGAAER